MKSHKRNVSRNSRGEENFIETKNFELVLKHAASKQVQHAIHSIMDVIYGLIIQLP